MEQQGEFQIADDGHLCQICFLVCCFYDILTHKDTNIELLSYNLFFTEIMHLESSLPINQLIITYNLFLFTFNYLRL